MSAQLNLIKTLAAQFRNVTHAAVESPDPDADFDALDAELASHIHELQTLRAAAKAAADLNQKNKESKIYGRS